MTSLDHGFSQVPEIETPGSLWVSDPPLSASEESMGNGGSLVWGLCGIALVILGLFAWWMS